ncbi:hypothetical protein K6119_07205 [Paracrocinitomix mangrovi]|uniref:hypothetical protein n=1 Tax=Paracrocinitomix mangrovi TaxID=2862509 RepID=UPI001C8D0D91|nr:hypothetical protein [Paracrocinitomix mangrovi]UKN03300.1 hypothetical protein K6119_07205 [Paracrocinitomix mangrovi]
MKTLLVALALCFSSVLFSQTEAENYDYSVELIKRDDCRAMECGYVLDTNLTALQAELLEEELYNYNRGVFRVRFSSDLKKITIRHVSYVRVPKLTQKLQDLGYTVNLDYSTFITIDHKIK